MVRCCHFHTEALQDASQTNAGPDHGWKTGFRLWGLGVQEPVQ